VAVVPHQRGKVVLKVDMLVEGTDMPPGMTYRQAARKAVAMSVSDFASKGVRPDSFLVSLGVKRGTTQGQVEELARGLRDGQREWGVRLVGGDTNESKELVIDCAMVGFAKRVVGRSGASPGDVLVTSGTFGYPPSGLKIMMAGAAAEGGFGRRAKKSVLEPSPDLEVGLALGRFLTSGMDSSDGLARCLHMLARESGVGFEVRALPIGPGVRKFARANGLDEEELVLQGGEEYLVVGTVRRRKLRDAEEAVRRAGGRLIEIGRVTPEKGRVDSVAGRRMRPIPDEGWTHLC
jgi:thiamine-monophosphate kinase